VFEQAWREAESAGVKATLLMFAVVALVGCGKKEEASKTERIATATTRPIK